MNLPIGITIAWALLLVAAFIRDINCDWHRLPCSPYVLLIGFGATLTSWIFHFCQ